MDVCNTTGNGVPHFKGSRVPKSSGASYISPHVKNVIPGLAIGERRHCGKKFSSEGVRCPLKKVGPHPTPIVFNKKYNHYLWKQVNN